MYGAVIFVFRYTSNNDSNYNKYYSHVLKLIIIIVVIVAAPTITSYFVTDVVLIEYFDNTTICSE